MKKIRDWQRQLRRLMNYLQVPERRGRTAAVEEWDPPLGCWTVAPPIWQPLFIIFTWQTWAILFVRHNRINSFGTMQMVILCQILWLWVGGMTVGRRKKMRCNGNNKKEGSRKVKRRNQGKIPLKNRIFLVIKNWWFIEIYNKSRSMSYHKLMVFHWNLIHFKF